MTLLCFAIIIVLVAIIAVQDHVLRGYERHFAEIDAQVARIADLCDEYVDVLDAADVVTARDAMRAPVVYRN